MSNGCLRPQAITRSILRLASGLVKGLRVPHVAPTALRAAHALDEPSVEPGPGIYAMARQVYG